MHGTYRGFGSISKVEDQPDGTIKVYGIASTGARDAAGEIVEPDAMKAALPDYSKFPALREMHQPSAAGKVLDAYVDDDGYTQIEAHVVDPVAVTKVKTGVYGGFSIGGKVLKRDADDRTVIKQLRLAEISLVDSPCNPECTLNMWKADAMPANPTNEETIAKAKEMAAAAGRKNFKDFLFKARESLIEDMLKAAADDAGDEGAGDDGVSGGDAASSPAGDTDAGSGEDSGAGDADAAAGEGSDQSDPGDETTADKSAASDPVTALDSAFADALEKANAAKAEAAAEPTERASPLADFAKSARALRVIGAAAEADLAKGMYSCARLASIIDSVSDLQQSVTYEAEYEGDNSPLPKAIAGAVANLCTILVQMVAEETAEIVSAYSAAGMDIDYDPSSDLYDGDDIELARAVVDLVKADTALIEKVGARNSKGDAEKIQGIHDHATALGATCAAGNCGEDSEKMVALASENERLAKALADAPAQVEEIAKAFNETIDGLRATVDGLTKRLEQVESEPAAPKTATMLTPVTKGQDVNPDRGGVGNGLTAEEFRKAFDELPEDEKGKLLLKVALANPLQVNGARAAR